MSVELRSLMEPSLPEPRPKSVRARTRRRPDAVLADGGYDYDRYRRLLWQRGIRPVIAKRGPSVSRSA
ncbi:hypothetical protein [Streptomyces longisporoflavus]|uniref:hypothetical protein n=1 Tax=Streptomyces longisporoflavus TaxID=28044 RepID=UPI00167E74BD